MPTHEIEGIDYNESQICRKCLDEFRQMPEEFPLEDESVVLCRHGLCTWHCDCDLEEEEEEEEAILVDDDDDD